MQAEIAATIQELDKAPANPKQEAYHLKYTTASDVAKTIKRCTEISAQSTARNAYRSWPTGNSTGISFGDLTLNSLNEP